jgi:apolipoprotein N-acyltransferase
LRGYCGAALRMCLAVIAGLMLAAAFPKADFSLLAWVALVPLVAATEGPSLTGVFGYAFVTGVVFFAGSLYWIAPSVQLNSHKPLVVALNYVAVLSAVEGLFIAVAIWSAELTSRRLGLTRLASFPTAWVAMEWLRSWFPIGFPWNPLGGAAYRQILVIQLAALIGVSGVSALVVLINVVLWKLLKRDSPWREKVRPLAVGSAALTFTLTFGLFRMMRASGPAPAGELKVAMVQADIPQQEKWEPNLLPINFEVYAKATSEAAREHPDLIVWPETAAGFVFQPVNFYPAGMELQSRYWNRLTDLVAGTGVPLLFGAPAIDMELAAKTPVAPEIPMRNRAYLLAGDGRVGPYYDKVELVPVGEYSLKVFGHGFKRLVEAPGDFVPGDSLKPMTIGKAKLGILICYESIFPRLARSEVRNGADLLVNMTNDSWYGRSSAPYQLLAMAATRAVENGVPMIRVANSGISAVIEPTGRIMYPTELFTRVAEIRAVRWNNGHSFYVDSGYLFAPGCFALFLLALCAALFSPARRKPRPHRA